MPSFFIYRAIKLFKGLAVNGAYSIIILNHQPMNRRHALQSLMGLNKGLSEPVSAPRPINVGEKINFQIDENKIHFFNYETKKAN